MNGSTLIRRTVKLNIRQGLHIRACSAIIALVGDFDGQVRVRFGDKSADATSMFDLVQLAAPPGSELVLEASGDGAEEILDGLESYLSHRTEPDHAD
jgi:phosphotransferase system HPr (HPr) family protein